MMARQSIPYLLQAPFWWFVLAYLGGGNLGNLKAQALSQTLLFKKITVQDGLISNQISHIRRDAKGFLWIGTLDGLQQYDGLQFTTYTAGLNPSIRNLSNGVINHIYPTPAGDIWVSTEVGGHCRIEPSTGKVQIFDERRIASPELEFNRGVQVAQDNRGTLWVASRRGLYQMKEGRLSPRLWPDKDSPSDIVSAILPQNGGKCWLINRKNLILLDEQSLQQKEGSNSPWVPQKAWSFPSQIFSNHLDASGKLWLGCWDGSIYRMDTTTAAIDTFRLPVPKAVCVPSGLATDNRGNLWIATEKDGLWCLPHNQRQPIPYHSQIGIPESYIPKALFNLYIDPQQILWVGTDEGLFYTQLGQEIQQILDLAPLEALGKTPRSFERIIQTRNWGTLLASLSHGLFEWMPGDSIRKLPTPQNFPDAAHPDFIFEDRAGTIWIGTFQGIYTYHPPTGRTQKTPALNRWFKKIVFDILQTEDGHLWFAMPQALLIRFDPITQQVWAYEFDNPPIADGGCRFTALCQTDPKFIWVGSATCGILKFNLQTESFEPVPGISETGPPQMSSFSIDKFFPLGDSLYFALHSHGLGILNLRTGEATYKSVSEGLPSNRISGIIRMGNYDWIFTHSGLARMDRKTGAIIHFNHQNGLFPYTFHYAPVWDPQSGTLLAATTEYLVRLKIGNISPLSPPPPVQLMAVSLYGHDLPVDSLLKAQTLLKIPANKNMLSLEVASLDFRAPQSLRYQYQLQNLDTAWVDMGHTRTARFSQLPGGQYTFRVRSAGVNGDWNTPADLLTFQVLTPIWKRAWFILAIIAFVLGLGGMIYWSRLRRLTAIFAIRNKISRDLHDEIGSSLSSISILSQIALAQQPSQSNSDKGILEKINAQSRRTLESLDDIIWTIQPANDKGEKLQDRLLLTARDLLEPLGITYRVEADLRAAQSSLKADQRWHCLMIVREALNNATKYAQCSEVIITLATHHHSLHLTITDNGIGFEIPAYSHRNGLQNMENRANALKGSLSIQTAPGQGTSISLSIPI